MKIKSFLKYMFMKKNIFFYIFSFVYFTNIQATVQLNNFCNTEEFKRASIGIYVKELDTGKEVFAINQDKFFIPASLQKIITSMGIVHFIGEEYRFVTALKYDGEIDKEGVLNGNIWIYGGGDPSLSLDIFEKWQEKIYAMGIKKIAGKVFIDSSYFDTSMASPYWNFEDLGNYYGAGPSGLTINQNLYKITFIPGKKIGDPATVIKSDPYIPKLTVYNEVTTGPKGSGDNVYVFGSEYSSVQYFRGTVPIDEPQLVIKAAIPDPVILIADLANKFFNPSEGVEIIRNKRQDASNKKMIMMSESAPIKDLLKEMNAFSINIYAEHFIKEIGQGNSKKGLQLIENYLMDNNISCQVKDGSGLARINYITPKGFVELLQLLYNLSEYQVVYDSFAKIGDPGTLANLPLLSNNVFIQAKTGSMSGIYNLGGYLILPSNKKYAFSILCNNYKGPIKDIKNEVIDFLNFLVKNLEDN